MFVFDMQETRVTIYLFFLQKCGCHFEEINSDCFKYFLTHLLYVLFFLIFIGIPITFCALIYTKMSYITVYMLIFGCSQIIL